MVFFELYAERMLCEIGLHGGNIIFFPKDILGIIQNSMRIGFLCSLLSRNYSAWRYNAVESFYWLKSSHSGFFFRIFIIRTAKIVRILHKWYFTTYIFSVDVKDLNPWRKLELWQGSLSCEQCAGLFCTYWVLQALVQELCPCISVTRICLLWQQFGVFLPHLLSYLLCKNTFPSLLLEWLGSLFLKNMS